MGPTGPSGPADAAEAADVAAGVRGVVQRTVEILGRGGRVTGSTVTEGLESSGRALVRRVVAGARVRDDDLADRDALARALAARPRTLALGGATSAALAVRLARRFRHLGFLARRTPAYLVATAVPALAASVGRGADELGMIAAHLVQRAHAGGVEPDMERVRRAAVQIASRVPVDPETEPGHGVLVVGWLRRAFRAALPFTAGVATADPRGLADAAGALEVERLGAA